MIQPAIQPVSVMRGELGPLPGARLGDAIAYEFELDQSFVPRPGKTRLERVFLLLDIGVQLSNPPYWHDQESTTWYVDLVTIAAIGNEYTVRDLYIDVMIPTDGRHYRMLDLDEYGQALGEGSISLSDGIDGLHRWQQFLDRHLHAERFPAAEWSDFPPAAIKPPIKLPTPLPQPKG